MQALRALDRLYLARGEYRELADNLQRQLKLVADDPTETVALLGRLGALREQHLGQLGGAVDTYRRSWRSSPSTGETIAALERILPSPEHELDVAHAAGADLQDPRRLAAPDRRLRDRGAPRRRSRGRRSRSTSRSPRATRSGWTIRRTPTRRSAGALGEDPQNPEVQASVERLARALRKLDDLVAPLRPAGRRRSPIRSGRTRSITRSRASPRPTWATTRRRRTRTPRRWTSRRATSRRRTRSSSSTCAAPTTTNLVELLLRKAEIVDDVAEKKALYFRAAQLYEEVLENLESAIDVFQQVLSVDDGDKAALDQLERLYIRLGRWDDLKDVYAKKAELAPTPDEKKQMLFVLGQVYDRELGDPERAIETYSSILDLDPEDYDAAQALDRLYQQPGAGTTCSRSSSARSSWRRRRPRWCRCATASASCGEST